jgi:hypothetical protein
VDAICRDNSPDYFDAFGQQGYALGVNVAVWAMTH